MSSSENTPIDFYSTLKDSIFFEMEQYWKERLIKFETQIEILKELLNNKTNSSKVNFDINNDKFIGEKQ